MLHVSIACTLDGPFRLILDPMKGDYKKRQNMFKELSETSGSCLMHKNIASRLLLCSVTLKEGGEFLPVALHITKRDGVGSGQTHLDLAMKGSWNGHQSYCVHIDTLGVNTDCTMPLRQWLDGCLVLNLWQFFLPGDIWQCPETFSVITLGMSWGVRGVATEIWWVEARDGPSTTKVFLSY